MRCVGSIGFVIWVVGWLLCVKVIVMRLFKVFVLDCACCNFVLVGLRYLVWFDYL